jgi:hypothetical protein
VVAAREWGGVFPDQTEANEYEESFRRLRAVPELVVEVVQAVWARVSVPPAASALPARPHQ